MHSKNMINETKNKETEKIKLGMKVLVGLQPIYLLDELGMSSKLPCATHLPLQKVVGSPSEKQAVGSFLTSS